MSPHGLRYPDAFLAALPVLLPRPAPHAPIRALDAAQFAKIRALHVAADVPDSVLFPFLHGLEGDNHAQTLFFSKHGQPVPVPDYRGLIWVAADDEHVFAHDAERDTADDDHDDHDADPAPDDDDLFLDDDDPFPAGPLDLPSPVPASDASSLSSSVDSIFSSSARSVATAATSTSNLSRTASPKRPASSHLLTSSFRPADILTATPNGPAFIPPTVPKGISLRNFGIQVPIYATLSDIVVYSPKGLTRAAFALAERLKLAIEAKAYERRAPDPIPYNVFIITDPFSVFERDFPDLVAVTASGAPVNHVSFPERELQEMQDLTRATEIHPGVWVGNTADVPMWQHADPDAPFDASCNPHGYDICIECHDQAPFPHSQLLKQAEDHLAALDSLWASAHQGPAGGAPPRPPPNANTIIHFAFPSSPPATQPALACFVPFLAFLDGVLHHRARPCRILLYSNDGYTESSVLALALLMAAKRCALPDAYLELQVARARSFFVHPGDLGVLKRLELKYSRAADREKERAGRERWGWSTLMGRGAPAAAAASAASTAAAPLSSSAPSSAPAEPVRRARAQTSPLLPALADHQAWFGDARFDGSFPSRVLPFLYLGNLHHAANAYMLHALGITHVVSVGECALVPPLGGGGGDAAAADPEYQVVLGGTRPCGTGSLWKEEREGRIKVLDIKGVCDDGIDSLRHEFANICDWIERARVEGGKVLVHCRVGVSRSATVTIAYVMKHLQLPLVDAYLIVRSRRLSVLIQPNVRLLYNLCGWEVELARQRAGGADEAALRHALKKALNWPYLAREVHLLNEKYLH